MSCSTAEQEFLSEAPDSTVTSTQTVHRADAAACIEINGEVVGWIDADRTSA